MSTRPTALGIHCFMGALTRGIADSLDVKAQLEMFDLGELTVEHNLKIPFFQATDFPDSWREIADAHRDVDVIFGNPRCTGFSALGHGCSEDAHGAWSKPTVDIRQLAEVAGWLKPKIWGFESVQQAGTTGRDLLGWLVENYGKGYRFAELYHNAAQFGSSQHRRRVFFVWYREDLQLPVEEVTEECLWREAHRTVGDVLSEYDTDDEARGSGVLRNLWGTDAIKLPRETLFEDLKTEADVRTVSPAGILNHHYRDTKDRHLIVAIEKLIEGRGLNSVPDHLLPEDLASVRRRGATFSWHAPRKLHRDRACPVVYSGSHRFLHPEFARPLTVRELARLMGLDDTWVVLGADPVAQLGKGVCRQVGSWLGKLFAASVTGSVKRVNDLGAPHEVFRFDRDYGWTPKKPAAVRNLYPGEEEDL